MQAIQGWGETPMLCIVWVRKQDIDYTVIHWMHCYVQDNVEEDGDRPMWKV